MYLISEKSLVSYQGYSAKSLGKQKEEFLTLAPLKSYRSITYQFLIKIVQVPGSYQENIAKSVGKQREEY
jgi:hypothetical protein